MCEAAIELIIYLLLFAAMPAYCYYFILHDMTNSIIAVLVMSKNFRFFDALVL